MGLVEIGEKLKKYGEIMKKYVIGEDEYLPRSRIGSGTWKNFGLSSFKYMLLANHVLVLSSI